LEIGNFQDFPGGDLNLNLFHFFLCFFSDRMDSPLERGFSIKVFEIFPQEFYRVGVNNHILLLNKNDETCSSTEDLLPGHTDLTLQCTDTSLKITGGYAGNSVVNNLEYSINQIQQIE
jgi:hypothetical protein